MKPTLAVWKFASCDGCQLTLLDCEDELLALAGQVDIRHFPEASSAAAEGPFDVSLVEGSITTEADVARIHLIREQSGLLVAIGACATAGGIQALRNAAAIGDYLDAVYAHPQYVQTLATSTPASAHVTVDLELHGCPIDRGELVRTLASLAAGSLPRRHDGSVCLQCKLRGTECLLVAAGTACLGPVTRAGCGAICPAFDRGCFGCFGRAEAANLPALREQLRSIGTPRPVVERMLSTFTVTEFQEAP